MILGFPEYESQARGLAEELDLPFATVAVHRFPDGESKVSVPTDLPERVILCRSLDHPNDKLVELMLAAATARELGARHLSLVAPYLCYMRQDIAFTPGEAVSQRIVGRFLGELFDGVITVDPHLHRIDRLSEAIPRAVSISLNATESAARFLAEQDDRPLLIGPDSESEQWVRSLAERVDLDYVVANKQRRGDREVEVVLPAGDYSDRSVVLVDDMASTGHTLQAVATQLLAAGARSVRCLVTHALLDTASAQRLHACGIETIWSSDSIPHPSNAFSLAPLLARALRNL